MYSVGDIGQGTAQGASEQTVSNRARVSSGMCATSLGPLWKSSNTQLLTVLPEFYCVVPVARQPPIALSLVKKNLNVAENVCLNNAQVMELGAFASMFPECGNMQKIDDFFIAHSSIDSSG